MEASVYTQPWMLVQNKIVRYPGGREIDRFRGVTPAQDDRRPEAWVGSDTPTMGAERTGDPNDGCAEVILPDGTRKYLFEALREDPEAILGPEHVKVNGSRLGVLVKLLDSQYQLGLQCHPSRAYAKKEFNSDFGKEESWYVIGLREDTEETPYILMGFKEDATPEKFAAGYMVEDIHAMEQCCHKIPVQVGDAFFIAAGLPHAIGGGVFVVEVQEPSDITVGAERSWAKWYHAEQEEYDRKLLNCYDYSGAATLEENLKRHKIAPKLLRSGDWGKEEMIIGPTETSYFSFTRMDAVKEAELRDVKAARVCIVLQGEGKLVTDHSEMEIRKADEFFVPFSADCVRVVPKEGSTLSIILAEPEIFD